MFKGRDSLSRRSGFVSRHITLGRWIFFVSDRLAGQGIIRVIVGFFCGHGPKALAIT